MYEHEISDKSPGAFNFLDSKFLATYLISSNAKKSDFAFLICGAQSSSTSQMEN